MKVRSCAEADVGAVLAIYAHHVRTGLGTFEEIPPSLEDMQARFSQLQAQGFPFLIAESPDSQVAGYAYVAPFRTRSGYRYTCEDAVYIAADQIRRGVGKALMAELISRCRALKFRQMLAVIGDSDNAGSIGLHRSLGFRTIGTFKNVGFKFDRWVDVVLMQLHL